MQKPMSVKYDIRIGDLIWNKRDYGLMLIIKVYYLDKDNKISKTFDAFTLMGNKKGFSCFSYTVFFEDIEYGKKYLHYRNGKLIKYDRK